MFRLLTSCLVVLALASTLDGQTSPQTSPGAPPNPNTAIKPNPPSPATPADAPFPDRAGLPEHQKAGRVKRAVKSVAPNCLDWMFHTCWSQPLGPERSASEIKNPRFAHDMEVGTFNLKHKSYRGAELRFRSALDAVPDNPEANFKLAKSLEMQGKAAQAREEYTTFLTISSNGPFAAEARKALLSHGSCYARSRPPVFNV